MGSWLDAVYGFISAVVLMFIGSRLRIFEQKGAKITEAKIDAQSKILNWVKDCLDCLGEIKMKLNATVLGYPIRCEEEYGNFQKLEDQGQLALGFANILGGSIPKKTKVCLDSVHRALIAFKNRDDVVWDTCRGLESSLTDLIGSLTKLKM